MNDTNFLLDLHDSKIYDENGPQGEIGELWILISDW